MDEWMRFRLVRGLGGGWAYLKLPFGTAEKKLVSLPTQSGRDPVDCSPGTLTLNPSNPPIISRPPGFQGPAKH